MNNIKVNNEIIKKTTKCKKNFRCLSGETPLCKVEERMGEVIFIMCKEHDPCQYRSYFGYSQVCTCPVRKELYSRYKI